MTWKKCAGCTRAIAANAFSCEYCGQLCDDVMGYLPTEEEARATTPPFDESHEALRFAFENTETIAPDDPPVGHLTLEPSLLFEPDPATTISAPDEPGLEPDVPNEAAPPLVQPAASASAKPSSKSLGPRQLAMVGGGVLAAGALIFTILGMRGSASPEPAATANPAPAPAPRAAAAAAARPKPAPAFAAPPADAPHWNQITDGRWITNNRHTAAFEVAATKRVHVWTRDVTPVLVVRCESGKTEAFVYTQSAARMEPEDGDHTVTVAFDNNGTTTERWPDSDDHDALFARRPAQFTRQLTEAQALHFGFTPHNAQPVVATFALTGLEPLLQSAAKQCGWSKPE
jgi:hypothetical protein